MFVGATALDTSELDGPPDICPVAQLASPPLNTGKNASFADWATYGQEVQTQWFSMDCQNNSLCDKQTGRLLSLQWFVTCGNPVENLWASGANLLVSRWYAPLAPRGFSHWAPLRPLSDMFMGEHALWMMNYFVIYLFACILIGQCPMSILMNDLSCNNQAFS